MAINDIYQAVVAFSNDNTGKGLSFTINGRQESLAAPSMADVGDAVKGWWNTGGGGGLAFKEYCAAAISLTEVTLRRVKPLEPVIQSYTTGLPIAGTDVSDPGVAFMAPLVTIRTGNIGKSYRGRMYLPPIAEAHVGVNASITAGDAEDIAEGVTALFAALDLSGFQVAVWSRTLDLSTDVTGVMVDRILRTQRRRQDRSPVYVAP